MKKISHLQKGVAVMVIILLFSIGEPDWWRHITMVCNMYFIVFVANLFYRLYESENPVTRFFFGKAETPFYVAVLVIILSVFVHRIALDASRNSLYICAFVGGFATTVAKIKSGQIARRS